MAEAGEDRVKQSLCQKWKGQVEYRNLKIYRSIHARTTIAHVTAIYHNRQIPRGVLRSAPAS